MDLAEVLSLEKLSLNGEAPRFVEKSDCSPSCESPLKRLRHLVQLLAIGKRDCQQCTQLANFFFCTEHMKLFAKTLKTYSETVTNGEVMFFLVFRIRRLLRVPGPDPLVRGTDPDPFIINQKYEENPFF
jgi:hypothetical protein